MENTSSSDFERENANNVRCASDDLSGDFARDANFAHASFTLE